MHMRGTDLRSSLRLYLLLPVWVLALVTPGCRKPGEAEKSAATRPNVLLVVLDTARADYFSGYGHKQPTSPHIDRLATGGVRFTRAFATDFWTLPTHASLFTGLYPGEAGATAETNHLPDRVATIAERLRGEGYATGAVVGNAWISKERGFGQGFTDYAEMWRKENRPTGDAAASHGEQPIVERAVAWIKQQRGAAQSPFFLFVNFNVAHLPYNPPREVRERFATQPWPPAAVGRLMRIAGMWPHLAGRLELSETDFRIMRDLYAGEISRADSYVGQLIDTLTDQSLLDDTLVIVTSDHGENIGDHGMIDHLLSMHETTLHIPLVIHYPRRFAAGTTNHQLVSLVDIMPTILDVCGVLDESEQRRVEMTSLCREDRLRRLFVVAENERPVNGVNLLKRNYPEFDTATIDNPMRAIRTQRHKLIWDVGRKVQLFDLEADPGELQDLSVSHPKIREELLGKLKDWMEAGGSAGDTVMFESRDAESLERLRSLGYIE